jgi:hypothetical protein
MPHNPFVGQEAGGNLRASDILHNPPESFLNQLLRAAVAFSGAPKEKIRLTSCADTQFSRPAPDNR